MIIVDLFQVRNYASFIVHIRCAAPQGLGKYRCMGCALKTNLVESISQIMLIERVAAGFRNDAHLFLKIRAAFAGKS